MPVPKKRTSRYRKKSRKSRWTTKGSAAAQKAFSSGKSSNSRYFWPAFKRIAGRLLSLFWFDVNPNSFMSDFECVVRLIARDYPSILADFERVAGFSSTKERRKKSGRIEKRIDRRAKKRFERMVKMYIEGQMDSFLERNSPLWGQYNWYWYLVRNYLYRHMYERYRFFVSNFNDK